MIYIKFLIISISILCYQAYSAELRPDFKPIELKEFTTLQLDMLPDAGTQLIFPFQLDNPDLTPSLKIRLTNKNGFNVPASQDEMKNLLHGQNTLTILGVANPEHVDALYVSNLFITIGGFNLSIALKTTNDTTKHVSNIIFNIPDSTRNHMIESAVKRKMKKLDDDYNEKVATLNILAKQQSLSHISVMAKEKQRNTSYKEDGDLDFDNNRVTIYAEKLIQYGDDYKILLFELNNNSSSDLTIQNIALFSKRNKENEKLIPGSFSCDSRLNSDETIECSFATLSDEITKALRLRLNINTDRGEDSFTW